MSWFVGAARLIGSFLLPAAVLVTAVVVLKSTAVGDVDSTTNFGDPLPGLDTEALDRFAEGKSAFEEEEDIEAGLGPVFNDRSCASCHGEPATGGGAARLETRFGRLVDGVFDPLLNLGGPLIQTDGIGYTEGGAGETCNYIGEMVPAEATIVAQRLAQPLFGLGLIEAVPDSVFLQIAHVQAQAEPGIAGRPNLVEDSGDNPVRVGRFGWKAQIATLTEFAAAAYRDEMGVTTPKFPNENCPQGNCAMLPCDPVSDPENDGDDSDAFADFMRLLAPPPRGPMTPPVLRGEAVFGKIGCAGCHLPLLSTRNFGPGGSDSVIARPFSDFLLHDIGTGDGIVQGAATGDLMRTAPLWGLRVRTMFLHDGRATTPLDAIQAHARQGAASRDRFNRLSPEAQDDLAAFLNSL